MDREQAPIRNRPNTELFQLVTEMYGMLRNNTQKIEELCQEKNQSPRTRLESRTDAVIQNTQLLIKKIDENEKNVQLLTARLMNLNSRLEEVEDKLDHNIPIIEKGVLEVRTELEKMRRDFLTIETEVYSTMDAPKDS